MLAAPVHVVAHALPPIPLLARAPTASGLAASSCSCSSWSPMLSSLGVGTRSWQGGGEEGGLLWGSRLLAVDVIICPGLSLARSSRAPACSLAAGLPVLALARSPWAGLTLTRLLSCWCTDVAHIESSPHLVVAAAAAPDTSSRGGTATGRAGRGREGKERQGRCSAASFSQAGSVV